MKAEILEKINSITEKKKSVVDLSEMNINDDEIDEIMNTLNPFKSNISVIDLDNNNLTNDGAIILSKHLEDFHLLEQLSLNQNAIGLEGANYLFTLKEHHPDLKILLCRNPIEDGSKMAEIESRYLKKNSL